MKAFLRYTAILLLATILIMTLLDVVFTAGYKQAPPINKLQYSRKYEPQQIDYLFLGSSRVVNHIMPEVVDSLTGKKSLNLGIEGALPADYALQLELLLARGLRCKTLFLQVDHIYNSLHSSPKFMAEALPYLREEPFTTYFKTQFPEYHAAYYVPFYRYMTSDYASGLRSLLQNLKANPDAVTYRGGFRPREGERKFRKSAYPKTMISGNPHLNRIKAMCDAASIELVLYCSPVCSMVQQNGFVEKLEKRLPGLMNYANLFPDSYFGDCRHLTEAGARVFTARLMEDWLKRSAVSHQPSAI